MKEDILVPAGVTLTISPHTVVRVWPSQSTKIDPEFISHRTEITVRGTLQIDGNSKGLATFQLGGENKGERWAGIVIDGGKVKSRYCTVEGAEAAFHVIGGSLELTHSRITDNRYGMIVQGKHGKVSLDTVAIQKNEYGVFLFNGADITRQQSEIARNSRKDIFESSAANNLPTPAPFTFTAADLTKVYGDESLPGETVWKGRVLIKGQVRIPLEGRLVIYPGTIVEFSKKDTNGDGIGENGLMIQGMFIAKGTPSQPILFRSAETQRKRGDWDAINILGSDAAQNLIEFCQVEDAYRGLHFHFSNIGVNHAILRNNYRGAQFQESLVEIRSSDFFDNISGIQARDSEVVFHGNRMVNNGHGASFFRLNLKAANNYFMRNRGDGLRIREGATVVEKNVMTGNRFGLIMADAVFGKVAGNIISQNLEGGASFRDTDNIEIQHNIIQANGLNGINLNNARSMITGNLISENGERGLGIIGFSGRITQNNIMDNGLYAIGLDDEKSDIDAAINWWGDSDLDKELFDRHDDQSLGKVIYEPQSKGPVPVAWSLPTINTDVSWSGAMRIADHVEVLPDAVLSIRPGTTLFFSPHAGMDIHGRILAEGTKEKRITFTSTNQQGASDWEEILLDRASGSRFVYCDFEYATWGIHSHFSDVTISYCRFRQNDGGIRFRSGPLEISHSLFSHNRIGLRAFRGTARIHDSIFTKNEIGIFVREQGDGLTINRNNIFANERYSIRLGDFNKEDVDARGNWWGGVSPLPTIFDGHQEEYIGKVMFEPYLNKQLKLAGGDSK